MKKLESEPPTPFHLRHIEKIFAVATRPTAPAAKKRHAPPVKPPGSRTVRYGKEDATRKAAARKYVSTITNAGAAATSPTKPLTEKQKLFARYWAEGDTLPAAARRAGYPEGSTRLAYSMIHMPAIRALYDAEKKKYEEAGAMTRKKVMDMLVEAYDVAKMVSEPSSMVAAAREIGKMCGYYAPVEQKVSVSVSGRVVMDRLDRMSDEELLKIITAGSENTVQLLESSSVIAGSSEIEAFSEADADD